MVWYYLPFKVIVGIEIPLGITANVMCLAYIIWRLKLNSTIKKILLANALSSLICLVSMAIGYVYVIILEIHTAVTCSLLFMNVTIAVIGSMVCTATLSWVRYKMASKASGGEIFDNPKLQTKLNCLFIGLFLCQCGIFWLSAFEEVGLAPACFLCYGGYPSKAGWTTIALLNFLTMITLYYDFELALFIRSQSRVQPIQMAVWSVVPLRTSNSPQDVMSDSVPIKSTILTSVMMIFNFLITCTVIFIDPKDEHGMLQFWICVVSGWIGIHMFLILAFTVKSQEKNTLPPPPVPPQALQYYDNENVD